MLFYRPSALDQNRYTCIVGLSDIRCMVILYYFASDDMHCNA